MTTLLDTAATARIALACLDLTSLNDDDTEAAVLALCQRAVGPAGRGSVAAVCVWPRFAALARAALPAGIRVAAVANFPHGNSNITLAVADTRAIVRAGADEVDVVMPFREPAAAPALLRAVREACPGLVLKVILETGELSGDDAVAEAAHTAMEAGADFIKTSTGKVRTNATLDAARVMLQAIESWQHIAGPGAREVGFKPAGGVRTVAEAAAYLHEVRQRLGDAALTPTRFRIGASALLNDIEAVLGGMVAPIAKPLNY